MPAKIPITRRRAAAAGLGITAAASGVAEALTASFADLVQFGAVTRDWYGGYRDRTAAMSAPVGTLAIKSPPAAPAPTPDPQARTGSYANDYYGPYYGPAEIRLKDGTLAMTIGPRGTAFALRHWDGNVSTYTPSGENAPDGSIAALTFSTNPASFSNDLYNESGMNRFVRR
jgi:hypothetical protein